MVAKWLNHPALPTIPDRITFCQNIKILNKNMNVDTPRPTRNNNKKNRTIRGRIVRMDQVELGDEIAIVGGTTECVGNLGYINLSKGFDGYTSTGNSAYVVYENEDGCLVAYPNAVRLTSIEFRKWKTEENSMENQFLDENPKVAKQMKALCALLEEIAWETETHASMIIGALTEKMEVAAGVIHSG